jgi:D-alanyl-D-alanine carboxypeptidase/D-alanyl-D-alanine-endopeptidase (penicillin-binding protein 4)
VVERSIVRALAVWVTSVVLLGAAPVAIVPPVAVPSLGGEPWTSERIAKLDADIDALLAAAGNGLGGAHVGVLAVATGSGRVLYAKAADEEFQPASTLKLIVGSAALDRLGPAFHPVTSVALGPTSIDVNPGGDPLFGLRDVDALAAEEVKRHVSHLDDVFVYTPAEETPTHPDGWTFDDFAQDYAPPVSPAVLEENVLHLHVSPGESSGAHAHVTTTPDLDVLAANAPVCSAAGRFLVNDARTGPPKSENTLDVGALSNGCRVLVGSIAIDASASDVDVAVPDAPLYLARAIVAALRAHGVSVAGSGAERHLVSPGDARTGFASPFVDGEAPDYITYGLSLGEVMPLFWIPSDNFIGETLLIHLAGPSTGPSPNEPDARARALENERTWLRSIGVDPATTTLADGSGLSQYDRITPRDLVTILQHDFNGPSRQIVFDSLPIGGARGTIEGIAGTPAAGRVFAKTGSMMHVRGLAGYLVTERHGAVTFAFNVDDWIGDYTSLAATRAAVLSRIVRD